MTNRAVVITPTIGSKKLIDAVMSVKSQSLPVDHLLVIDGVDKFRAVIDEIGPLENFIAPNQIETMTLPWNTGKQGGNFYGHRIYAAVPHLVPHEYIFFLDEDNWFEPNHCASLVKLLDDNKQLDWAHSLRRIWSADKTSSVDDNCESLGRWPVWVNHPIPHLVDTSSYAFKRDFLIRCASVWHFGWGGDRNFLARIMEAFGTSNFATTGLYTLNYRLDGNPNSVTIDFFLEGNARMAQTYGGVFPWTM